MTSIDNLSNIVSRVMAGLIIPTVLLLLKISPTLEIHMHETSIFKPKIVSDGL